MRGRLWDTVELVTVTVFFPVLWVATRAGIGLDKDEEPLQVRELWGYHKRFWRDES
jgi:hypothetical protein